MGSRAVVALALGALGAAAGGAAAQAPAPPFTPVDRIAAIVGTVAIPLSRVDEEVNMTIAEMQRSGRPLPQDSAAFAALRHRAFGLRVKRGGNEGEEPIEGLLVSNSAISNH